MKRFVSAFFFLFIAFNAFCQYGQEWIQFGRPYFKVPVARDGLYRITYADLRNAGLAASPDPRTFQLFHRGVEQSIIVAGEQDGVFNTSDYIEFVGKANDGTLDSSLYENPAYQPHRYYNLYSDTTAYFLTYGQGNGKRMSLYSAASSGLPAELYHLAEIVLILKETYSGGVDYGDIQKTVFDEGEGWMGALIRQDQEFTYAIEGITDTIASGGKPLIEVLLTGRGPMSHKVELYSGTRYLASVSFSGYQSYKHAQSIEWSDIDTHGKFTLKIKVISTGEADRISAGYVRLVFPQRFALAGVSQKFFVLPENPSNVSYVKIQGALPGTRLFDVTDPSAPFQLQAEATTSLNAVVPFTSAERKILATSETLMPAWIKRVSFRQIDPGGQNYVIITHPALRKPAMGYLDPVKAYAEYRSLPEGGGFDTLIVNIDQLYDEFNFGEPSPRAIFQFMKFLASGEMPEYLFLIGKGLDVNYGYRRNPAAFTEYRDLVPSAGYPASDMAFTAGLSGTPNVPSVATGRLTAVRPEQVVDYLDKVKERDALTFTDLRRKKILHLSGGIEESEPALFRSILQGFESVAEGVYLGGDVKPVSKQSTDVRLVNIADEVNQGLGLITFFGHSAPNTQDFDIGRVTDPVMGYNNAGKYPFLLMNGCDAGSFFLNASIFGENWVQTAGKGAIGFIAHSSFGRLLSLQRYSSTFYDVAFGDSVFIKKGVGEVQREVARRYVSAFGSSAQSISQIQQMVLLGDPAVKLFGAEKPDYAIADNDIYLSSFDGEPITAYTDSFEIHIPVRNYGIADDRNIRIEVSRQAQDQNLIVYDSIFPPVLYSDTLSLVIRNRDNEGSGINIFSVTIDADNQIDELSEANNTTAYEYFIPSNSTRNLFPYNYSIVKSREVQLSFQYTDLQTGERTFRIELDTASSFDSGFKQQYEVTAQVLGKQKVELLNTDTLVYYWRTRLAEPLASESQTWAVHSFTYIDKGPEGWAQVHFPQFNRNESAGLVQDPVLRRLRYKETESDVAIKTFSSGSGQPQDSVSVKINGVEFNLLNEGGACRNNTINLIAFDRRSTQPYAGLYFKWYELLYDYGGRRLLCGREPYVINSFTPEELATGNQDDLIQYVDNIHEGDSVILFSMGDAGYEQWPDEARMKLGEIGVSLAELADFQDGEPVVVFGRKGSAPGTAKIFRGPFPQSALNVSESISGRYTSGNMSSVIIGPARQWNEMVVKCKEAQDGDVFSFDIVGITSAGRQDTLKTEVVASEDISFIAANAYPYLKLVYKTGDDINLTPVQLSGWLVFFEPVPDGLVFHRGPVSQQVRFEGEILPGDFGFVNISDKTFSDSLTVRYDLLNHLRSQKSPETVKIAPPLPGDTTLFTLPFSTVSKEGLNDVEVFVNPHLEKEKSYDNNVVVLWKYVNVISDRLRPVIEVTFDGRFPENLEFVRANPDIAVRLWDENPFLRKKDTVGINIFLAFPCGKEPCSFQRIDFSRPDVTWEPATANSDFMVHFTPQGLAEGTYTLRVEGGDGSGNASGDTPYQIAFRVAHERTVIADQPHPNPFYLQTDFDIIVSGDGDVPYFYTFQLFNLNGVLIREFSDHDAGLHVGKNRITWDGLDGKGKNVADGIYVYRLLVNYGATVHEHHGKVMLLR